MATGVGHLPVHFQHVPGIGGAPFGTQAAVQAKVLVLHHDPASLQAVGHIEQLFEVRSRGLEPRAQVRCHAVFGESDAVGGTDIHATVALDTGLRREHGSHIAIQAPCCFIAGFLHVEAQLELQLDILQRQLQGLRGHLLAVLLGDGVVVGPLVNTHLLAGQRDAVRRAGRHHVFALQVQVDGDGGRVSLGHRGDDVFRTERRVAAEEHVRQGRLERLLIQHGHAPLVERQADIAFNPREGVLLTDGYQYLVAGHGFHAARGDQRPLATGVTLDFHMLELDARQHAAVVLEGHRHHAVADDNAFVECFFLLPGRGLHLVEAGTHDNLHVLGAKAARRTAAVHGGVATAQHHHAAPHGFHMAERQIRQPFDTDMNMGRRLGAPGQVCLAAARCTRAHEDGIPSFRA